MSMRVTGRSRSSPSMRELLNNYHNKREENNNAPQHKLKHKKSLRGMEIVHVLPKADVIDLSRSLSQQGHDTASPIPSNYSSEVDNDSQIDEFIRNQYHFLENHNGDSSSQYESSTKSKSERDSSQSTNQDSNNRFRVRFSDVISHPTDQSSDGSRHIEYEKPNITIPYPDYEQESSAPKKQDTVQTPSSPTKPGMNHLDEIRQRFSLSSNGGLKTTDVPPTPPTEETIKPRAIKPSNPVEELILRIGNSGKQDIPLRNRKSNNTTGSKVFDSRSKSAPVLKNRENGRLSRTENRAEDDPYLIPRNNIGVIHLED